MPPHVLEPKPFEPIGHGLRGSWEGPFRWVRRSPAVTSGARGGGYEMLRHPNRLPRIAVALLAAILLTISGCGADETPDTGTTPPGTATQPAPMSPAATGSPTAEGTTVTGTLTDFKVALSAPSFTPGAYTFVVEQKGQRPRAGQRGPCWSGSRCSPPGRRPGRSSTASPPADASEHPVATKGYSRSECTECNRSAGPDCTLPGVPPGDGPASSTRSAGPVPSSGLNTQHSQKVDRHG